MSRLIVMLVAGAALMLPSAAVAEAELAGVSPLNAPALELADVSIAPQLSTQAGARTRLNVGFSLLELGDPTTGDDLRSFRLDLAPGLLGAVTSARSCAPADLARDACAPESRLGAVQIRVRYELFDVNLDTGERLSITPGQTITYGTIFRVPTTGTEAARLGIVLRPRLCPITNPQCARPIAVGPPLALSSEVRLRPEDGGLTAVVPEIPRRVPMTTDGSSEIDIAVDRMDLALNPASGAGRAFLVNPTSCTPATSRIQATSYEGRTGSGQESFTPTGCDSVPFDPTLRVTSSAGGADLPTALTVDVQLPYDTDPSELAQTQPRIARVSLPEGFELSPIVGSDGLEGCTDEQFARTSGAPATCPAGSQIGTVRFVSPLIDDPLSGRVFIATPKPGGPKLRIFMVAEQSGAEDALRIKLSGVADPDPRTGQVTATLENIPPLAFTDFRLAFRGGDSAVFSTPRRCGTYTATSTLTPFSAGADRTPSSTLEVSGDCPDPAAFTPTATAVTASTQAGATTPITSTITRPDRQARLRSLKVSLPPGLLGRVAGVPRCALDAARSGDCPADTRVGTVVAQAGPGERPLSVTGPVFLTPSIDGSFAGLAIVVPAKVGPIDLGDTITLARLVIRPTDQGLDVFADELPQRQSGVALSLRQIRLALDRPDFTVAPTNCSPQSVVSSFTSDLAGTAGSETPYRVDGCEALPFAPAISATLGATRRDVSTDGNPTFRATVGQRPGESGTRGVSVTLPTGISTNPTKLAVACRAEQFESGRCPEGAVVGTAQAQTPLLDDPLSGRVLLVAKRTPGLPDLRVQLRGAISIDLIGRVRVSPTGQLITDFDGVPDVPLQRFDLQITGGTNGLLTATQDMCTSEPKLFAGFTSHSGARSAEGGPVVVQGCRATASLRVSSLRRGAPEARLSLNGAGRPITSTRLTLPRGLTINTRRARQLIGVTATGLPRGTRATVRVRNGRVDVTFPRGGAAKATVRFRRGALRVTRRLRSQTRPRLAFSLQIQQPGVSPIRSTLRTRPVPRI